MQPLAAADHTQLKSSTNLSTSLSLTMFDRNGNEISVETAIDQPFEFLIPRDPNLVVALMSLVNVTSMNAIPHYQLFNLHSLALPRQQWNNNRTVALIVEMHPLNTSLGYLFIYRFDTAPQLTSSIHQIDGWSLFCPSNLTNTDIHRYFLNNEQTAGHQSIVFGLRQLNTTELNDYCSNQSVDTPPITNEPFNFTSNYELRSYTACCYYLDQKNIWRTNGLVVGPKTNHRQTQCFSTHLTTFTGGSIVLSSPIHWQYLFSHADFGGYKTIYFVVICLSLLFINYRKTALFRTIRKTIFA